MVSFLKALCPDCATTETDVCGIVYRFLVASNILHLLSELMKSHFVLGPEKQWSSYLNGAGFFHFLKIGSRSVHLRFARE